MIKGISEVRRLPRLGKIRLGIKETSQKSGNPYPKAVDYFVCNADQSTSEAAAKAFHEIYGDKPRSLDVVFPTENKDQFFQQWYRRYGSGTGLMCKGDGETAVELDKETGELRERECNPDECEWAAKKHCRPIGSLLFLLPKVPGLGAWQIDTSSYHSIVNLNSAIDFIRALTGGRIGMIPLKLVIRPKEVQVEGKKKVVHVLDLAHEEVRLADVMLALKQSPEQLFLPPAIDLNERPDDLIPDAVVKAEPAPHPAKAEATPFDGDPDPDPGPPWGAEVDALFDRLGFPAAKRQLWWTKSGQDVARMKAELLKRLPPETEAQPKMAPAKVLPIRKPEDQPPATGVQQGFSF